VRRGPIRPTPRFASVFELTIKGRLESDDTRD